MKGFKIAAAVLGLFAGFAASAQTSSTRQAAVTYGARLTAKGQPANLNERRINNRNPSRIETRLSLRIERYRPDSTLDPTAALKANFTDTTRVAPKVAPPAQTSVDD